MIGLCGIYSMEKLRGSDLMRILVLVIWVLLLKKLSN